VYLERGRKIRLPLEDSNLDYLIQRGPCNCQNSSMLHSLTRARVIRCWSSAFPLRGVAELRSPTRQVLRVPQL